MITQQAPTKLSVRHFPTRETCLTLFAFFLLSGLWTPFAEATGGGPSIPWRKWCKNGQSGDFNDLAWNYDNFTCTGGDTFGPPDSTVGAEFKGGAASNANCNITTAINVRGLGTFLENSFDPSSAYTGTVTISSGLSITLGSFGIDHNYGTINASGATNLTLKGPFKLTGGTFSAPSGTLMVAGGDFTHSGGTFTHNNGTIKFLGATKIDVNTSLTLYNVTFEPPITGGQATSASLYSPNGVAVDSAGNLYIGDTSNHRIRKVDTSGTITTVAGNGTFGFSGDGGPATSASLYSPNGVAVDSAGNLYIGDTSNHRIRKVDTSGTITTVAGNGTFGFSGDGGPATSADLNNPTGVALDGAGNLYIADHSNHRIRKVDTSGLITTVAGTGTAGFIGDAGPATSASLNLPFGVALDGAGNLYIGDSSNHRVRKVDTSGLITTVAGNGTAAFAGDGGPATSASLNFPKGVALDTAGSLYIADHSNHRIRKVDTSGLITTVAGTGTAGFIGDAGPATFASGDTLVVNGTLRLGAGATINGGTINAKGPIVVEAGFNGGTTTLLINGAGNQSFTVPAGAVMPKTTLNNSLTTITLTGNITLTADLTIQNGAMNGLAATSLTLAGGTFTAPAGTMTLGGNFTVAGGSFTHNNGTVLLNGTNQILSGSPTFYQLIKTPAGADTLTLPAGGTTTVTNLLRLKGPSSASLLALRSSAPGTPAPLTLQAGGTMDLLDLDVQDSDASGGQQLIAYESFNSGNNTNWSFPPPRTSVITTVAGNGTGVFSGDGGPATSAGLANNDGVAVDGSGNFYIADTSNHRIRKVTSAGIITTVAGNGTAAFAGDGGAATSASLNTPFAVAVDGSGSLYIADQANHRIRKVSTTGTITTVAGNGTAGFLGDGGAATSARLNLPSGVALDGSGNLYIGDLANHRIRKVSTTGTITTVAGIWPPGFSGDGGAATSARLWSPIGVALDTAGNLYIADENNHRIRKVDSAGIITTVAGNGTQAFAGDGGAATSASLAHPYDVAVDADGNFYIADSLNRRIRKVTSAGTITTVAGNGTTGFSGDGGPATSAALNASYGVDVDASGNFYIADAGNARVRRVGLGVLTGTGVLTLKDPVTTSAALTNNLSVNAEFTNLESDATVYVLSNTSGGFGGTTAIPSKPFTTTWTLPAGADGDRTVYARVTKGAGSYDISDLITVDTTPPAAPTGLALTAGADGTSITANVTAPATADVSQLIFRYTTVDGNSASPSYPADSTSGTAFGAGSVAATPLSAQSLTASSLAVFKTYGVRVWAKDAAGNVSTPAQQFLYLGPPTPRLVITAPNSATNAVAGSPLTLTITAKDANGAVIAAYAGPYTLNWTPMGSGATALVSSSSTGWSGGAVTANVTIGGSAAGPGTFTAVDTSGNGLTTGSLAFTFYPGAFTVATTGTGLIAGETFPLTVTARDSAGVVMTRYNNTVALFALYINPPAGAQNLSATSVVPTAFASGVGTVNLHYPDAGGIQILARDTTYASGVTITGSSSTLTFKPKSFKVEPMPLPPALTRPYVNQPFDVRVTALAADGTTVTGNYGGTVTLAGEGFGLTGTHIFVPTTDHGAALVKGVRATSAGTGTIKATEGSVSGQSAAYGARAGVLVLNSVTGLPGALRVSVYIKDTTTGLPVGEDSSTRFTISLANDTGNAPAIISSMGPFTMVQGAAGFPITKTAEGSVTINAAVEGFPMSVQPATVTWSNTAGTSSTTTFQVIQFEQAAGTTTLTTMPTTTTAPTTDFLFMPPPPTSTTTPIMTTSSYQQYQQGLLPPPTDMAMPDFSGFTIGGTRYDAAVTMGYSLFASPSVHSGDTYLNSGYMSPGFSPLMFGPPPALRSKMEGLAQSWKDGGKLNAQQFDAMMEGIQTGQKPEGADAMFGQDMGPMMMPKLDFGMMMGPPGAMDAAGMPEGATPWMMGPGSEGMDEAVMIFDPTRGGWLHEGSEGDGFLDQEADEEEEGAEQDEEVKAEESEPTEADAGND